MTAPRARHRRAAPIVAITLMLALVPSLTACAGPQTGSTAAPAAVDSTQTSTPVPDDLTAAQLMALAVPPTDAVVGSAPEGGVEFPATVTCGATSVATSYWTATSMTATSAQSWLAANAPAGMKVMTDASPSNSVGMDGYVLDAAAGAATQGLLFTVAMAIGSGVDIRVDAVDLPQSAACVSTSVAAAAKATAANAAAFAAAQAKKPDAAAQQKAQQWAVSAVVPPGSVTAATQPSDGLNAEGPESWWCAPMATVTRYWTLSGMSVDAAAHWLRLHPSPGLVVSGGPDSQPVNPAITNASVIDMPALTAVEGMDFSVAQAPGGVAIRAVASAESSTVTCLNPPAGGQWGVGG